MLVGLAPPRRFAVLLASLAAAVLAPVAAGSGPVAVHAELPAGTGVRVILASGLELSAAEGGEVILSGGEPVEAFRLELPNGYFFQVDAARVRAVSWEDALGAECDGAAPVGGEAVEAPLSEALGALLETMTGYGTIQTLPFEGSGVAFRSGGTYRLCYSYNGSYAAGSAASVLVNISVRGVSADASCTWGGCLSQRAFSCFGIPNKRGAPRACGLSVPGVVGPPSEGGASWTERFTAEYAANGLELSVETAPCGADPPAEDVFCPAGGFCNGTDFWVGLQEPADPADTPFEVELPQTQALASADGKATVAICYCSGLRGCTSHADYGQQIGVVHIYVATAAPPSDLLCSTAFAGVLSPLPFVLCVHCPPGGCEFDASRFPAARGRLRMVRRPLGEEEEPAWSSNHSCRTASTTLHLTPRGPDSADVDGGPRSDFKRFVPASDAGFRLEAWTSAEPLGAAMDVCLCFHGNCSDGGNGTWFKAGQLAIVPPRLVTSSVVPSGDLGWASAPPREVAQPGRLALNLALRAYDDPDPVLGLKEGGGLRLVIFDRDVDSTTAAACAREGAEEAAGFATSDTGLYGGIVRDTRYVFDGNDTARAFQIQSIGAIAICYCAVIADDGTSCADPIWAPIGAMAIAGPKPNQWWMLPTSRITRIEFEGAGLEPSDRIRLIEYSQQCEDAPPALEICPRTYTDEDNRVFDIPLCYHIDASQFADYRVQTLTHQTVGCDERHQKCLPTALIKAAEARAEGVRLRFATDPRTPSGLGDLGLRDGDIIVLDSGVQCGDGASCTREILREVRGVQPYVGLEAYFDFDGPLAEVGHDEVGGRGGSLQGDTSVESGRLGSGLQFTSSADAFVVDKGDGFDASQAWSLLAWVKMENVGRHTICGVASADMVMEDGELEIGVSALGKLFLEQKAGGSTGPNGVGAVLPGGEVWTHVAVVYGGQINGDLLLYVDGSLSHRMTKVSLQATDLPLTCGGRVSVDRAIGRLLLDEVRWYNIPLSDADVAAVAGASDPTSDRALIAQAEIGNRIVKGDSADPREYDIPGLVWSVPPVFEMAPSDVGMNAVGSGWKITNRASTRAELLTPTQQYTKVCWERDGRFAEVGTIVFRKATLLTEVGIYLTAEEWLKTSPFILTFKTADATSSTGKRYEEAEGTMTLELSFLNTGQFDLMSSVLDSTYGGEVPASIKASNQMDPPSQKLCGQMFKELWSDDTENGFPHPKGCTNRMTSGNVREVVLHFEARNGLRAGKNYHMVMNGWYTNQFDQSMEQILINSGDDIDLRHHDLHEVGHAYADKQMQIGATLNDPRFSDIDGVEILGGDDTEWLDLAGKSQITWLFRAGTFSTAKIKKQCLMTFWLWPLTQWRLPVRCYDENDPHKSEDSLQILCDVHSGSFRRCGFIEKCSGDLIVPYMPHVPKISIQMPDNMNDLYGTLVYSMRISNFMVPPNGFFPRRLQAQVRKPDGTKPYYVLSSGKWLTARPGSTTTLARLLYDATEDLPYGGDPTLMVYVKLLLPTDLRGAIPNPPAELVRPASLMEVVAPDGFTILGVVQPSTDLGQEVLTDGGDGAAGLSTVEREQAPTGFGFPDPSGWSLAGRRGLYTLPPQTFVAAGSSVVVGMRVQPKNESLSVSDPENRWTVVAASPGEHTEIPWNYTKHFYRTGLGGVPVLCRLEDVLVQPSDARFSPPGDANGVVANDLSVFFHTPEGVPERGFVDVEAPDGFDFGLDCEASDLNESYYVQGPPRELRRLPTIIGCAGRQSTGDPGGPPPRTVARVQVEGVLVAGSNYGFRISVVNPAGGTVTGGLEWGVRTRGPMQAQVCASPEPAFGAFGSAEPFRLREALVPPSPTLSLALSNPEPGVAIELESMVPNEFTGITCLLLLPFNVSGELRVIAPEGFEWLGGLQRRPGSPWEDNAVFEEIPGDAAILNGVLRFLGPSFVGGVRYGFRGTIYVPSFTPTASVPAFFVDVAAPGSSGEFSGVAAVVPSPEVRSLVDADVMATSRLPGSRTGLLLQIRLATPVAQPGALFVQAPMGFRPHNPASCELMPWPGKLEWDPSEAIGSAYCFWEEALLTVRPSINAPIPAGLLQFRVEARSPEDLTAAAQHLEDCDAENSSCWFFGSYNVSYLEPPLTSSPPGVPWLDKPQTILGMPVAMEAEQMALLPYEPEGRDDRPLRRNVLAFVIRLAKGTDSDFEGPNASEPERMQRGFLELSGPYGFQFDQRCLSVVETRRSSIFGDFEYYAIRDWGVSEWELDANILDCEGRGRTALISIDAGLLAHRTYVFTIAVRNPEVAAPVMNWTMSFHRYFSRPFASFPLWTFTHMSLSPLAVSAGPSCYLGQCIGAGIGVAVPVTVTFRNFMEVETDGELQITMPLNFGFDPIEGVELIEGDRQTRCILREYRGTSTSAPREEWLEKDRDCLIADRGDPRDGTGTGDTQTIRVIPRYEFNEVDPAPPRSIKPSSIYQIIVWVLPPAGFPSASDWNLESRAPSGAQLDIGWTIGYDLSPVFKAFSHNNEDGFNQYSETITPQVIQGRELIPDFVIELTLPGNAFTTDRLYLTAPPGFKLQRDTAAPWSPDSCIGMQILSPEAAANSPYGAATPAVCSGNLMDLPLTEFVYTVQSAVPIKIMLELRNPETLPPSERNYWIMEHFSGGSGRLQSSAIMPSWFVVPKLADATCLLTGDLRAAGAKTTISFLFKTVSAASEVLVEAIKPPGFDFADSFARAVISGRDSVPSIMIAADDVLRLVMIVDAYDEITLNVEGVRLPLQHEDTLWNVTTYALIDVFTPPELRDGDLFTGFKVPGRIGVMDFTGSTDGVEAALLGGREVDFKASLFSTAPIEAGDGLQISLEGSGEDGFFVRAGTPVLLDAEGRPLTAWICAPSLPLPDGLPNATNTSNSTGNSNSALNATNESARLPLPWEADGSIFDCCTGFVIPPEEHLDADFNVYYTWNTTCPVGRTGAIVQDGFNRALALKVLVDIPEGTLLTLRLQALTPPDRTAFLFERWRIVAYRGVEEASAVLITTNDAEPVPLSVVTLLPEVVLFVPYRPPLVMVQVTTELNPVDTGAVAFFLTAPSGFKFPENCVEGLEDVNPTRIRCTGTNPPALPKPRVLLDCAPDGGTSCLVNTNITFSVETPARMPEGDVDWYVEAVDDPSHPYGSPASATAVVGWTRPDGFDIDSMPAKVIYGSVAGVTLDVGIVFWSRVNLTAGDEIYVVAPRALKDFRCGSQERGRMRPLTLGDGLSCARREDPMGVSLRPNRTLPAGYYVLAVPALTSHSSPPLEENAFDIYLRDAAGVNMDVALRVPGEQVVQGLRISIWPLWWVQADEFATTVQVTVPFEVLNDADQALFGVLIVPPADPLLELVPAGVQVDTGFGDGLPVTGVDMDKTRALLRLDGSQKLLRGLHLIRFSIVVPAIAPSRFNLWRVALCDGQMAEDSAACSLGEGAEADRADRGAAVFSVFTLAGFDPRMEAPGALPAMVAAGAFRRARALWPLATAAVVAAAAASWAAVAG